MQRMQAEKQASRAKRRGCPPHGAVRDDPHSDGAAAGGADRDADGRGEREQKSGAGGALDPPGAPSARDATGLPAPPGDAGARSPPAAGNGDEGGGLMGFLFDGSKRPDARSGGGKGGGEDSKFRGMQARPARDPKFETRNAAGAPRPPQPYYGAQDRRSQITLSAPPPSIRASAGGASDRELIEMEIIKSLVASYFDCVRKNFMDMVPKTIMFHLVNHARENIQSELVRTLYRDELFDDVLRENDDVALRRKQAVEMETLLQRALEIVNEVRDFNAFK
jgi:dynamin 1-like protein